MPSVIPGYEYDIFVSYRHNDNKYDGWVSEFVGKLNQELDATLKDRLSVFFDQNPQEGLLETHQVDTSIQNKIKALIFIPIISQTYCDTKSFAWNLEFKVFKSEASKDKLGRDIKLTNGNFASRILPVRIHDIDQDDVRSLEDELSGSLRSVDFIYRDAGVNRSLRPVDDELVGGPGKTLYRNQINKLANAIKELIQGIKIAERGEPVKQVSHDLTARQIVPVTFSTSLPSSIKVQVIDREKPGVFLAWTSSDMKDFREEIAITLQKAGFNVLPSTDCPANEDDFKEKVNEQLQRCTCSLHILSGEYGRRFESDDDLSFPQFQFLQAKARIESGDESFHSFVWTRPDPGASIKPAQQNFIRYIRNNIMRNMMFSNSPTAMQLVDDIRVVMMRNETQVFDSKDTDIFFIFNQQDEEDARIVTDKLSLEYPIEIMNIMPDSEDQYRELSSQQIQKSKLAVVYFKYAADWALPFIKQIWKQVGGASSPTPLFLIGEDDPRSNLARNFKAPKVVSSIVSKENVPVEVKKVYTTVIEVK
jgi:hypothetical protein